MSEWMAWTLFVGFIVLTLAIGFVFSGRGTGDGIMNRLFKGRSDHDAEAARAAAQAHSSHNDGWGGQL